ncbi:MAG: hypothetical protein A2744_03235 [Candidatus Buchananbacteria bacterium RIFCSPHIGHO2_01_FULL_44_11]|uniref:Nucleoid-associated protein, YbaB/EbfC family n=1 Tax=Candidatus Buchananbacteria bacterium RIFCSPHIGHO2_01_FULL_44_11 TaxID=1797535 RepID=A0A1G1Y3U1_9BACT|nr:MAG: hypothetical protein A2744_03235 [Candidatus Buchananbacteria bacterium RIFCSPHIGHO2_01_FULL_44_11]
MFNKLKQFKELRSQAQTLKEMLSSEQITVENQGVRLVMDGNQKIISLSLPAELNKEQLERQIPELFDQALKQVQRLMVQKIQASGMSLPGMSQ